MRPAALGLRWRLMLIGTAGLSFGLALGGLLLLAALAVTSERSVDDGASKTASDVAGLVDASLVDSGQLPQPVTVAGAQLVQVVDGQDRVRAGSPGADLLESLLEPAELRRALAGQRFVIDGPRSGLTGEFRVMAVAAGPPDDRLAVIVAAPLGDDRGTMRALGTALLALFLPLVLGLAGIAWWVIGRTLRPVEALRAGAEVITGQADAGGRLPVPAGADEIHRLAVTLNDMLDRLESSRQSQRQFVADAAHELRNPLAGMRTHLEVAQRHPARVDWQELTDDLLTDTERLTALADGLLLLAGADEAASSPRRAVSAVPVRETLTKVAGRYREARVAVRVRDEPAGDQVAVWVNAAELHGVLTNLVDNAVRHARSGVWLYADRPAEAPGSVRITVTDDGPGIAVGDREFVFQRFSRLDDARATGDGGAGLGLAIVAELVRRNAGTVRLGDAEPGLAEPGLAEPGLAESGLRVEVCLPLAR